MSEADLKQEAEQRLGTEIESSEWDKAKSYAERKLKGIIERFGDEGGIRQEPWYLAQLIAETVQQNRFSRITIELMELNRYADMEIKKDSPCHKHEPSTTLYLHCSTKFFGLQGGIFMDNKNTLQITAQYPAERYNLLVPMQTVAEIAEIHKPVMNAVQISTNEADKEIYLQDRSKAKADGWALTKKGLNKLMRAAGIKILGTRPIIPSTCQKCAEVNKSIGRPVNCGTCGNKDVKFEARISVPQLTGENIEIVAHKEIIVDDVSVSMTEFQKKEFLKFRSEMCETKAINRALRAAMHIKGTYSLAELAKPFVVAYLVPNLDNEAVKAEAVRHFFASAQELYGGHNTEARRAIFVEDDVEEGMEYETPGKPIEQPENAAYKEAPAEPPRATQERQQAAAEAAPDFDPNVCVECGVKVSNGVVRYSQQQYGRTLCMACQRKQGGNQ